MFYAYVIKSVNRNYYYKGHCEDPEIRLQQHNAGMTFSTKPFRPFLLAYSESFETEPEAIKREKYFKTAAGRRFLKSKIAS
jgi:putative endonuclease